VALISTPIIVIVGSAILTIFYLKRIKLLADRDAAALVGVSTFLAVLTKISGLDGDGAGKTNKRRFAGVGYLPTLQERILNLQKIPGRPID
jgi:hypothetical protein